MAAKKSRRIKKSNSAKLPLSNMLVFEIYGLILVAVGVITQFNNLFSRTFNWAFRFFTGTWDFVIPLVIVYCGLFIMFRRKWPKLYTPRWLGFFLMFFAILLFYHLLFFDQLTAQGKFTDQNIIKLTWNQFLEETKQRAQGQPSTTDVGGGMIGAIGFYICYSLFSKTGTIVISVFSFLIGVMLLFQISYVSVLGKIKEFLTNGWHSLKRKGSEALFLIIERKEKNRQEEKEEIEVHHEAEVQFSSVPEDSSDPIIRDFAEVVYDRLERSEESPPIAEQRLAVVEQVHGSEEGKEIEFIQSTQGVIQEEPSLHYTLPSLTILSKPRGAKQQGKEYRDMQANARKLEQTLESFGVNARVLQIHRGPAVTRYEVQPAIGVKVSKIVSLTDDIALALAAKDIRMEAPIPGKSAIGIEVPNAEIAMVTLREVLESPTYHGTTGNLNVALGRDISGEPIIANLAKMPHLLVAGATGSGKSVCINGIIASLLFNSKPHEVKLMMIDPKMVELNIYNGIPHLLAPVVTDPRRASMALKKVVVEMEKRYELFAKSGTRNIDVYNQMIAQNGNGYPLPYIVVIVDELADLMMVASGDVEDAICRLAQMARAAGIHLIIATQRPSVDVITGVIKANIPSRIAFGVSSMADSRTILDMGGAEKLLGRGDMLFLPMGASKPTRVQGAFLSDEEVEKVVESVKEQQEAKYHEEMLLADLQNSPMQQAPTDELYEDAVKLVIDAQTASASLLQRRFRIGYTRAARLIDMMEANHIVGPFEGSKPREVLIKKTESTVS